MEQRLVIEKSRYEHIGTFSIQGMAFEAGFTLGELTLVFQGSSLEYCREHDGPEWVMMPDYVPFCIIDTTESMIQNGWKIKIDVENR